MKKVKLEELLPQIINDLSEGICVSTTALESKYSLSSSSFRQKLRQLSENIYPNCFKYDGSKKCWKATIPNFLLRMHITPNEAIVLNAMIRSKSRLGPLFENSHVDVVKSYISFKKQETFLIKSPELITDKLIEVAAVINHAISKKLCLEILFAESYREVQPYKVASIGNYWYLIGFENSNSNISKSSHKIKTYSLSGIKDIVITDNKSTFDFSDAQKRLDIAMNAFIEFNSEYILVELLILERFVSYIDRNKTYNGWQKSDTAKVVLEGNTYIKYTATTTKDGFEDITPSILMYMPNIIVLRPNNLKEAIKNKMNDYMKLSKL